MAVAAQFGGDVLVGRVVGPGGAQDDAAAEGQRLGGGTGADEGFESAARLGIQFDHRGEGARHGSPPGSTTWRLRSGHDANWPPARRGYWRRIYETVI
jgi:hypothetical protein